jgi:hypothetical protein
MKLVEFEKLPIILEVIYEVVAITTKWTTLDLGQGLSESDSKAYTNFEYYEKIIHEHLQSVLIYKTNKFMSRKTISREVYIVKKTVQVVYK